MQYAVNFSAQLNAGAGIINAGTTVVCKSSDGATYVVANDANMSAVGGGVPNGVAVTGGNGALGPFTIVVQVGGTMPATLSGLGTAVTWAYAVRSSGGGIVRKTVPSIGDDVLGIVNPNGDVMLAPPYKWSAATAGLPAPPTTDGTYALGVTASTPSWVPSSGDAVSIRSVPVTPGTPTVNQFLGSADGINWAPLTITADMVAAGFTPTVSYASGGSSPVEVGATVTPTFTGTPLPNAAGVTVYTISDNQGGGPTSRLGSGSGFQGPSATYTLTAPGTISFTVSVTKGGINKPASPSSIAVDSRLFSGVISGAGATSITAVGNNATVSGGTASGTLSGALVANPVGQSFSPSPASQHVAYACEHTTTAHVVHDANGDLVPFNRTAISGGFTNQNAVNRAYDLYESVNLLTTLATPLTIVS